MLLTFVTKLFSLIKVEHVFILVDISVFKQEPVEDSSQIVLKVRKTFQKILGFSKRSFCLVCSISFISLHYRQLTLFQNGC